MTPRFFGAEIAVLPGAEIAVRQGTEIAVTP